MQSYLVTGAAGFIGAKVSEVLLARGDRVIGIDNLNDAYDQRLKMWRLDRLRAHPQFRFIKADVSNRAELAAALDDCASPAAVINLAARAGVRQSVADPWVYMDTNATGTLNLLEYCRTKGVRKFILASTSSLYGSHNPMPYREDADTNRPLSPYAASKKAAEAMCYSYHHLYGLDVTVYRYFTVYGPAGRPDMSIFRFVQWILEHRPVVVYGDGNQSRDFTYVDDIAAGTVSGLSLTGYQVINLGSDQPARLMTILNYIEELTGEKADLTFRSAHNADVAATWADISNARRLLDWSPTTGYEAGIASVVRWYEAERSWARDIDTTEGAGARIAAAAYVR
jgi:nucleoside-diphosphate-sugar epimerase